MELQAMAQNIDLNLDDPRLTDDRVAVLQRKRFLNAVYQDWYRMIVGDLPAGEGRVLEIGSGAGFLAEYVDDLVTSDIMPLRAVDLVFDACDGIPLPDASLRAIVMVNVFHHLPRAEGFLGGAFKALRAGGRIIMIEPWKTPWSSVIYRTVHHEPFEPKRREWDFESTGPLSGANGALPWIVFSRDRGLFERKFPGFAIKRVRPIMPLSYLLSGGFTGPTLAPHFSYPWVRAAEHLTGLDRLAGLFALVVVEKT